MTLTIGSLFSGIGGLELGLEWAGVGHTVWQVECDEWCREILAKHWPNAERYRDVKAVTAGELEPVDVICGGFPCQDVSVAGAGEGLAGARSGLWYEFARIVEECRPHFVVVENVAHGRSRWLPEVRRDLHVLGYRTRAYVVGASDVGAPHERRRCFVIADTDSEQLRERAERKPRRPSRGVRAEGQGEPLEPGKVWRASGASTWATFPDISRVDDGFPDRLERERALGNAVVPQVAEVIGHILLNTPCALGTQR